MKRWHKVAVTGFALAAAAVAVSLVVVSYEAPCTPAVSLPPSPPSMKAIVRRCYGSADVLALEDVAKPIPGDDEVLVKVVAAAVNAVDWHNLRGEPYVMRISSGLGLPKNERLGVDFAGTVEAVGKNVTQFHLGDEVFGGTGKGAAFAEYLTVLADRTIALKPANVTFEQAGSVAVAGITALKALRDKGRIRPGQKVLINGASGGVGTFAVQIAKAFGAEVTGVCSTRNLAMVREIGADHVVDYTHEDFTRGDERYDLIVDMAGGHSMAEYRRVLKPGGTLVVVGNTSKGPWLGPLTGMLGARMYDPFVDEELVTLFATLRREDLLVLSDLMQAGKVTPVIDRTYGSHEIPDAIRYVDEGHARAKVVVTFR